MSAAWLRRVLSGLSVIALAAGSAAGLRQYEYALGNASELSGWGLAGLLLVLLALNWRKKLSFLPLGRVYWWTQLHLYGGILALIVFWQHMPGWLPRGLFEASLAGVFLAVALSGVFGIFISRAVPPALRRGGEAIIFERIPGLREQLLGRVQDSVGNALEELGSTRLAQFYADSLHAFMVAPRDFWAHILKPHRPLADWRTRFDIVRRDLGEAEASVMEAIQEAVEAKINLDMQFARRTLLKRWLFLHVPLSYGLLAFVVMHVLLVYGYGAA